MNFYLSSYKLGNEIDALLRLVPKGKIAYIPNALDFSGADPKRRQLHIEGDMQSLAELGLQVSLLDLRDYFGKKTELTNLLLELGALFMSGGNGFVLRQAMYLSGLDTILQEWQGEDFLYAGYSAAGTVLSPDLRPYQIVDDPSDTPYPELQKVIWEGLGLLDYAFMPHWDSDHPESADIEKEIAYCKENDIPYRAIRDGEVIVIEHGA